MVSSLVSHGSRSAFSTNSKFLLTLPSSVELQFQIAQLFDVLGAEGYSLHQEIVSSDIPSFTTKNPTKSKDKSIKSNSSRFFVQSLLTTPTSLNTSSQHEENALVKKVTHEVDSISVVTTPGTKGRVNGLSKGCTPAQVEKNTNLLEKSESFSTKLPTSNIGALAAQAALKKSEILQPLDGKTKPDNDTEDTAFLPSSESSAFTTQAYLQKSSKLGENGGSPAGGIAALAAQAALKKFKKSKEKENGIAPSGGIASTAAQAALKKSKKSTVEENGGAPSGGIASLAAQAAFKTSKKSEEENGGVPIGGIAALAAQAALKKSRKSTGEENQTQKLNDKEDILFLPTQFAGEENGNDPVDGIGALAALAALKKSKKSTSEDNQTKKLNDKDDILFLPTSGIASFAAQAALQKSQKSVEEKNGNAPVDGIAALAAQAALKKSQKIIEEGNGDPPAGDIAALAAEAALRKSQKSVEEKHGIVPAGGIAALAAQAALKKSQKSPGEEKGDSPAGGVAALAAQAALKKSKKFEEDNRDAPAGGIAVLAAQAALKKTQKSPGNGDVIAGGIAALAAQAALKKSQKAEENGDTRAGGIAILAAKTSLKTSDHWMAAEKNSMGTNDFSVVTLMSAILAAGIVDATSNPRDVPAFCCLHLLACSLEKQISSLTPSQVEKEGLSAHEISMLSRRLLLRSLSISNQANSIGMIGWLEYGSSNLIDRGLNLPLEIMQQLSCNMAAGKDWHKASDVLSSLLLRCEQSLPRCHPTTICSMLDLAGALSESENIDSARFVTSQALDLLTSFLSEAESLFFDRRYSELYFNDSKHPRIAFFDDCLDSVGILNSFSKKFQEELSRQFLEHLGQNHPITLLNHSLVADSFMVLANCLSASEIKMGTNKQADATNNYSRSKAGLSSRTFWSLAFSHYDIALRGWILIESLIHPNAASITFSIARCLRELGKLNKAIKILETLASCLEQNYDKQLFMAKRKTTAVTNTSTLLSAEISRSSKISFISQGKNVRTSSSRSSLKEVRPSHASSHRFHPPTTSASTSSFLDPTLGQQINLTMSCEREQTAALCFWMMAVLTAEQRPDELGRNRALSLLHTASLTLQRVLSRNTAIDYADNVDDQTRAICLNLYERIEAEALDLFEPLERIPLVKDYDVKCKETGHPVPSRQEKRSPWEIITPMRQKRQWASPRILLSPNGTVAASEKTINDRTARMDSTEKQARKISKAVYIQRL